MPLLVGFLLVALFLWFAENIATFANAWNYLEQRDGWQSVPLGKLGSWFLLMIVSFVLVSLVTPVVKPHWLARSRTRTRKAIAAAGVID